MKNNQIKETTNMKISEVREMSSKDILERIEMEKTQLVKARLNHTVSPLENTTQIKNTRRDIAKMMTILRERQLNESKNS